MTKKKLTKAQCSRNFREERKSAKYYRGLGLLKFAGDELRHSRFFKRCM